MSRPLLLLDYSPEISEAWGAYLHLLRRRPRLGRPLAQFQRVWVISESDSGADLYERSPFNYMSDHDGPLPLTLPAFRLVAWPYVLLGRDARRLDVVDAYAANRPVAWVGRDFDADVHQWIKTRQAAGIGGLLHESVRALPPKHIIRDLVRWTNGLPTRPTLDVAGWSLGPLEPSRITVMGVDCRSIYSFATALGHAGAESRFKLQANPGLHRFDFDDRRVSWKPRERWFSRYGPMHQALLDEAFTSLFDQNPGAASMLLATGDALLDVGDILQDDPRISALTREEFIGRLHRERFKRGGW